MVAAILDKVMKNSKIILKKRKRKMFLRLVSIGISTAAMLVT